MKEIFKKLAKLSIKNPKEYENSFLSNLKVLHKYISEKNILKGEISSRNLIESLDLIRFSCVFNDLTLYSISGGQTMTAQILQQKAIQNYFGIDEIAFHIPIKKMMELKIKPKDFNAAPGFLFRNDEEMETFLKTVSPLIENGRLIVQPRRILLVRLPELNDIGTHNWHALTVDSNSPLDIWEVSSKLEEKPVPIRYNSENLKTEKELFNIAIPFISGISFDELNKIINDEYDCISDLRVSLNAAIKEASSKNIHIKEIINDTVKPHINKLEKNFKTIANIHKLKIAGVSFSTVLLGFIAFTSGDIISGASSILGAGSISLGVNEFAEYKEKLQKLREDPYYFFWKCKNIKGKV